MCLVVVPLFPFRLFTLFGTSILGDHLLSMSRKSLPAFLFAEILRLVVVLSKHSGLRMLSTSHFNFRLHLYHRNAQIAAHVASALFDGSERC